MNIKTVIPFILALLLFGCDDDSSGDDGGSGGTGGTGGMVTSEDDDETCTWTIEKTEGGQTVTCTFVSSEDGLSPPECSNDDVPPALDPASADTRLDEDPPCLDVTFLDDSTLTDCEPECE